MSEESRLREEICRLAKSMFDRGLTSGSSGNISARLPDGGLLVTPTGTSLGVLNPARLTRFDAEGSFIDGDKPTKELPLHNAFLAAESGIGILVEPLNERVAPGNFVQRLEHARDLVEATGHPAVRIMFDCYHMQIMGGDLLHRDRRGPARDRAHSVRLRVRPRRA